MTIKKLVNRFRKKCEKANGPNDKSWILGETDSTEMSDIDMCIDDEN